MRSVLPPLACRRAMTRGGGCCCCCEVGWVFVFVVLFILFVCFVCLFVFVVFVVLCCVGLCCEHRGRGAGTCAIHDTN
eukprot:m.408034 g.408034  ORF g.408034 m.408034 type:complete len:78 (+) comp20142_c1_seq1:2731-2964(+)